MTSVKAERLMQLMGSELVGAKILTYPMGSYPGGEATVTELRPDPGAPEIAFTVHNPNWVNDDGSHDMGIFTNEEVILL